MNFSKSNIINGIFVLFVSVALFFQTTGKKDAFITEGIHPMDYPRALIIILLILGVFIAFTKSNETKGDRIPIVTRRTISMCLSLILFGILFEKIGFALCAFGSMMLSGVIMGYRRHLFLCCISAISCACIWIVFTYILKIPLPAGTIW